MRKLPDASTLKGKLPVSKLILIASQHQLDLTNLEIKQTQTQIDATNKENFGKAKRYLKKNNLKLSGKRGILVPLK